MYKKIKQFVIKDKRLLIIAATLSLLLVFVSIYGLLQYLQLNKIILEKDSQAVILQETQQNLLKVTSDFEELKNTDPHKTNLELEERIKTVESTYQNLIDFFETIDDFENKEYPQEQIEEIRTLFGQVFKLTSELRYEEAASISAVVNEKIDTYEAERAKKLQEEAAKLAAEQAAKAGIVDSGTPVAANNNPPANGYSRQVVSSDAGDFTVSIVAGDLGSTRVIVDTASASDCGNDCPVLPLSDYVGRNGAYAGINGSYFCPASYPSCAGKTNSFDLLAMNKDKYYFNSDNNVYSTNPGVIFGSGYIRFVGAVSGWGRDTSIDGMLSNYPLLVSGGNVVFGGDDDPKKGSKGNRSFVANRGNTVYIGVVHYATVAESARVLKSMGMENALNLDDGGSTALWFGGYKVGPGRNLPNVILFTHR